MQHLFDIKPTELQAWFERRHIPDYRAGQIQSWLFRRRADQFEQMTDLPASLRIDLAESFTIWSTQITKHSSANDGTEKLLLRLADGGQIECVLLRDGVRRSICISSQVGCAMGCVFCASGLNGVDRNLTTGEIIEQVLRLQQLLPSDERLSHIVVMGMGEPLANLDAVLPALELVSHADRLDISARRITISTVGLPAAIKRLSSLNSRYQLAVSLHAPNDKLRNRLVPVNDCIGLEAILSASDEYFAVSGRRLTYEYVLLADVNDGPQHASELAGLMRGRPALVNLIPYNPVSGLPYRSPSREAVDRFQSILEKRGINVQVRKRKGDRINAACGQLRRSAAHLG
jgi:23S rRNA (adenine2503-C2)-methyltransferase